MDRRRKRERKGSLIYFFLFVCKGVGRRRMREREKKGSLIYLFIYFFGVCNSDREWEEGMRDAKRRKR